MQLVRRRRASTTSRYQPDPRTSELPPRLPSPTFLDQDRISLPYLSEKTTRRRSRSFSDILELSLVRCPSPMQPPSPPRLHSSRFAKSSTGSGWRSVTPNQSESSASTELPRTPYKPLLLPLALPRSPTSPDPDLICKPTTPTRSLFKWTKKKSSIGPGNSSGVVDVWLGGIGKTLGAPGGLLLSPASLSDSKRNSSMEALEQWESWAKMSQVQDNWSPSQKFEMLGCAKARMPLAERDRWRDRPRSRESTPKEEIVWGQAV